MNESTQVPNVETLQARLALKERQLEMVMAIDHVRDTSPKPAAMLDGIANVVVDQFQADLCLLCLLDRETGEVALKAINERSDHVDLDLDAARELARRVLEEGGVCTCQGSDLHAAPEGEALHLAAVPIILEDDERLGALLLARLKGPFRPGDVALLEAAESQIDSAVIQGYAHRELHQRNKELETIYRIDHLRDLRLPFDELLNKVLQELLNAIQAEMGFVMLYDQSEQQLELRATTHDDLFHASPYQEIVRRTANEALHQAAMVGHNDLDGPLQSILSIPLILQDEIIGVLGVVNRYGPTGFRAEDRRLLRAIGSQMDTAIFESQERRRLRRVLGRSVGPRVMNQLLANADAAFLEGKRASLSVLYTDMRNSTDLSERTDPELLVGFINDYLERMTEIVLAHEGTLDKFVGDAVMALFSAPIPQPDHALRAVQTGLAMQTAHQRAMERWQARGIEPVPIGVGIATGELIVGEMGCEKRTDYTAIGRAANLGSRLCSVARGGQVIVSEATYDAIRDRVDATPLDGLRLKGVGREVTAYHVTALFD